MTSDVTQSCLGTWVNFASLLCPAGSWQFWKYSLRTQPVICKFWLLIDWTSQKPTARQKEEIICYSLTAKIFERRESELLIDRLNYKGKGMKMTFHELREVIQWIWALLRMEKRSVLYKFASEVYFRWSKFALRVLNALVTPCSIQWISLPDKTFAERFALILFQVIIQSLVNFAVGYKYTKSSKRGKSVPQDFLLLRSALTLCRVVSFIQRVFLENSQLKGLWERYLLAILFVTVKVW